MFVRVRAVFNDFGNAVIAFVFYLSYYPVTVHGNDEFRRFESGEVFRTRVRFHFLQNTVARAAFRV